MILVKLMGGLGNQMFQYAAGYRLAAARNTELKLDISWFQDQKDRSYQLDCFSVDAPIAETWDLQLFEQKKQNSVAQWLIQKLTAPKSYQTIHEQSFDFDPDLMDAPDNSYLIGYWQSEKYFSVIADKIREQFTLRSPLVGKNLQLVDQITSCDSVSIHIRRGDYAHLQHINEVHGLYSMDYYDECIRLMSAEVPDAHFFIFSDEPEWAKDNLRLSCPFTIIDHNSANQCHEDLRLMSLCKHHIIANSSFSWWGAWLNMNPDQIVYAPAKWFSDPVMNNDAIDLIPAAWRRV